MHELSLLLTSVPSFSGNTPTALTLQIPIQEAFAVQAPGGGR